MANAFVSGQRFQIQRYKAVAGEYLREPINRHVVVQIRDSVWAERRGAKGNWVQFLIERGSLAIVPSGPVPDVRLLTPADMILCALEENFTYRHLTIPI